MPIEDAELQRLLKHNKFYEYPDGDLAEPLYAYVYKNRSQIGVPENFWTGET